MVSSQTQQIAFNPAARMQACVELLVRNTKKLNVEPGGLGILRSKFVEAMVLKFPDKNENSLLLFCQDKRGSIRAFLNHPGSTELVELTEKDLAHLTFTELGVIVASTNKSAPMARLREHGIHGAKTQQTLSSYSSLENIIVKDEFAMKNISLFAAHLSIQVEANF